MSELPLIRTEQLRVGHGKVPLLPPFDMEIHAGQFWAIVGRNGGGKSTWLRTLLGLLPPISGSIRPRADLRLAYLPQKSVADDLYPLTARDVVEMGCLRSRSFIRLGPEQRRSVDSALELMGATPLAAEPFGTLSEGQRQRVLFARIAASGAELALLDEPTSAMDLVAEREAFELLRDLQRTTGVSLLVVSHYVRLVAEYADHAVLLDRDTPAVVIGTPSSVFDHPAFKARYAGSLPPPRATD